MGAVIAIGNYVGKLRSGSGIPVPNSQYLILSLETTKIRKGIRNSMFVTDITITPLGYDGIENIDWENIISNQL